MVKTNNEWIKYGRTFGEFRSEGLSKSGTLIDVEEIGMAHPMLEEREIFLIGDINEQSGVCDDCTHFMSGAIVHRYKVIEVEK